MINWIKKLFNKNKKSSWTVINRNNKKIAISPEVMEYFNSKLPKPKPEDLINLISTTKKIIIYERSIKHIEIDPYRVDYQYKKLIDIDNKKQIQVIGQKLEIFPDSEGHILDGGSIIFDFILENNKKYQIEYLEGGKIRWKQKWKDDASLKNNLGLLELLKNCGIEKPLKEFNKALEEEEKIDNYYNKVSKTISKYINEDYTNNYSKIHQELQKEFPKEIDLILSLFETYYFGIDLNYLYPPYVRIPEKMLLEFSIETFNKLEKMSNLTEDQKRGIALFFSSDDFILNKKSQINKLSPDMKNRLLQYVIEFCDNNIIEKFKNSFLIN